MARGSNLCGRHLQSPVVHVQAVGNFPSEPEVAHFESCANSCADHDTPESAHEDDPGADDDTHESKHDDDSCPLDPAPVMAEPAAAAKAGGCVLGATEPQCMQPSWISSSRAM